jgi:hypothetical protein
MIMENRSRRLLLEQLEDRCLPSTYGVAWPGANKITVSFAPDGTQVDSAASTLFQNLNAQATTKAWEMEILRALQSWAANANINFGIMPDHGQALGSAGPIQGDADFGDMRFAARPEGTDVLALNTPYDPVAGTRSGDIVFNSNYALGINGQGTIDLFSLALHETGNALGLPDTSTDPTSVLYSVYAGVRSGPSASDIAQLQALYGARTPDRYEGSTGNNTLATATTIKLPEVAADITTLGDVDFYRYKVPDYANRSITFTVRTAGISLLTSRLTIYNSAGQVVAASAASDPLSGDVSIRLDNVSRGTTLYLKVEGARSDVFGVGSYRLKINSGAVSAMQIKAIDAVLDNPTFNNVIDDHHSNDTLDSATNLNQAKYQTTPAFDYSVNASLSDVSDVDCYSLVAPAASSSGPRTILVSVTRTGTSTLDPEITIYDASGNEVNAQVLANDDGSFLVQVVGATPGATYYVGIDSDPFDTVTANQTGNYQLGVNFQDNPIVLETYVDDVLNQSKQVDVFTMQVNETATMHFVLSSTTGIQGSSVQVAVRMSIYDLNGALIASLTAQDGEVVSKDVFLTKGTYAIRFVAATRDGSALPDTLTLLQGRSLTDPEDPPPVDPTQDPTQAPPAPPDPIIVTNNTPPTLPPLDPASDPWSPSA